MKKLSDKNMLLIGLTLFSMFFGAGNLIFPPFLGVQAGAHTWIAMAGFSLTAIGFPILGVAAVARSGGLPSLAGRVHPKFAFVFTLLIYLSIGPCLAIPRTASTSFEMAVVPFLREDSARGIMQFGYSLVFFFIAGLLAFRPDKLKDRLGKILTPCLLVMIVVIFSGCIVQFWGADYQKTAVGAYGSNAFIQGFLDGYQTMDTIAALNFGIIIAMNIKSMGVQDEKSVVRTTIKAGVLTGILLLLVYAALAHIGAVTGGYLNAPVDNGARALTIMVMNLYGNGGLVLLALIFFIACLNTCIGLLSCCSNYFCTLLPTPGYKGWVCIFAVISVVISNIGLNRILELSIPVLNAIYPIALVLIVLSFLQPLIGTSDFVYRWSILLTGITSVFTALAESGLRMPMVMPMIEILPFYELGLGWICPAVAGGILGAFIAALKARV